MWKKSVFLVLAAMYLVLPAFRLSAEEEKPAKTLCLANVQAVDSNLLERVRSFAEAQLNVPVRSVSIEEVAATNLQGSADIFARQKGANDVCVVALVARKQTMPSPIHSAIIQSKQVAIMDVNAVCTDDKETFARRIERQVMRAVAFLFGVPPALDPYCVTRDYSSLEDLDRMGRNFFPPSQHVFEEEARRRGLKPPRPTTRRRKGRTTVSVQ